MKIPINKKPEEMCFEDREVKCIDACKALLAECIIFEKGHKNKPDKVDLVRLVKICSKSCRDLIADECSAINLLQDCAKACDNLISECVNHDVQYCLTIDENCRKCRDLCNALINATIWIIIKAKNNSDNI